MQNSSYEFYWDRAVIVDGTVTLAVQILHIGRCIVRGRPLKHLRRIIIMYTD